MLINVSTEQVLKKPSASPTLDEKSPPFCTARDVIILLWGFWKRRHLDCVLCNLSVRYVSNISASGPMEG